SFPFFFFQSTAPLEIYILSLYDALPISKKTSGPSSRKSRGRWTIPSPTMPACPPTSSRSKPSPVSPSYSPAKAATNSLAAIPARSEEHTSELQSRENLVCRLLLEKKKDR